MTKSVNETIAEELLTASLRALLTRVKDGTATAADLTVAHRFITSSGVEMLAKPGNPMGQLQGALTNLPFAGSDGPSH